MYTFCVPNIKFSFLVLQNNFKPKEYKKYMMNVLAIEVSKEIKSSFLISIILISLFVLLKLIQNKKKAESKSTLLLTIVSVLITMVLFYIF